MSYLVADLESDAGLELRCVTLQSVMLSQTGLDTQLCYFCISDFSLHFEFLACKIWVTLLSLWNHEVSNTYHVAVLSTFSLYLQLYFVLSQCTS